MKKIIIALLCTLFCAPFTFANECIANPPEASVLSDAKSVSGYQEFKDPENQIVYETFNLEGVGEVLIRFESCAHAAWTVVFLTQESFNSTATQSDRFADLLSKISAIPIKSDSRFEHFKLRLDDWQSFAERNEKLDQNTYFLWRRNDDAWSDILLMQRLDSPTLLRTEISLNISL